MSTEIPAFLADVEWIESPPPPEIIDALPHVTHSGVLELFGHKLRCFRLSNGQAVFEADDFEKFMEDWLQLR